MARSLFLLAILTWIAGISRADAQSTDKEQKAAAEQAAVKNLVESRHYMFVAQTVMPLSGPTRALTTPYDLRVLQDTLNSDLPYFGRSFSSSGYGSADNDLHFKTTSFQYVQKDGKDGGWEITLTPKNVRNVRQITMKVSNTGFTFMTITSNTRQTISFNGYLRQIE